MENLLFEACRAGNPIEVTNCLNNGVNVNSVNEEGYSALMLASFFHSKQDNEQEYEEITRVLIKNGADVNYQNVDGHTAAMLAAVENHLNILKILVTEGNADIHSVDKDGNNVVMWAAVEHNYDIIKYLVNLGANVEYVNTDGECALHRIADFSMSTKAGLGLSENSVNKYLEIAKEQDEKLTNNVQNNDEQQDDVKTDQTEQVEQSEQSTNEKPQKKSTLRKLIDIYNRNVNK